MARAVAAVAAFEEAGGGNGNNANANANAAVEAQLQQLRERGPLAALLQTLAPWNDTGDAGHGPTNGGDERGEGGEEEEGGQR